MGAKRSKTPVRSDEEWPYTLKDLARFPTWMTIAATASALLVALGRGGPEAFSLAFGFSLGSAILFYSITFLIGGLGLIPAGARWLLRRMRRRGSKTALWDDLLDGP